MKIDDSTGKLPPLPPAGGRTSVSKTEATATPRKTDKVSLSGSAQALSAADQPPIDTAKVEQVRAAIAAGSFHVDADKIADGLIASNRELLQRK